VIYLMKDYGVVKKISTLTLKHLNICFQYHQIYNYILLLVITTLDSIIGIYNLYICLCSIRIIKLILWYSITPHLEKRFNKVFNTGPVELISRRNVHFVTINSMAMEMDGCFLCHAAKLKLNEISSKLKDLYFPKIYWTNMHKFWLF